MNEATFYRGLLYGLRCAGVEELEEGATFHKAFGVTLERGRLQKPDLDPVVSRIERTFDPVFGAYRGAHWMLLDAADDCVLQGSSLSGWSFTIEVEEAQRELAQLYDSELFLRLGRLFKHELGEAAQSVKQLVRDWPDEKLKRWGDVITEERVRRLEEQHGNTP